MTEKENVDIRLAFLYIISGSFVAMMVLCYNIVGLFPTLRREVEPELLAPPVPLGEVDEEELKAYDGSDPKKSLLMAIKGQIYDVIQKG